MTIFNSDKAHQCRYCGRRYNSDFGHGACTRTHRPVECVPAKKGQVTKAMTDYDYNMAVARKY